MRTNRPENFEVEIDRSELLRFFASGYRQNFWVLGGVFGFLGGLMSSIFILKRFERMVLGFPVWLGLLIIFALILVFWVLLVWLITESAFLIHGKKAIVKRVDAYRIKVEGSFLRTIDGNRDRKIHFRQIGDYEAVLGNKRIPEVGTIRMFGPSATNSTAHLTIWAIRDVLAMRDLLAEVDAERE